MTSPLTDLAVHIDDDDVALDQGVDYPGVLPADAALLFAFLLDDVTHIRPEGMVVGRHRPPHEHGVRLGRDPAAFELVVKAVPPQDRPRPLDGYLLHAFEDVVGHLRAPVGEALPFPEGGVLDQILLREDAHLCRGFFRRREAGNDETAQKCQNQHLFFRHNVSSVFER